MTAEPSGQDVSQRIRNAIKSKLVDIGCYVDDELPDYVMVMIANKKSKDQMKADLELFLGEYCGGFCDWLHQVLDHLQRFAREGKHKIDLFEEKSKSYKTKDKEKVHRWKDKERPLVTSSGSGDEVAFHLDVDEKREFEEDNIECIKKRESRRSRSRSPLKKIEERAKKKLRERVDEVTKEVKRKEISRNSGNGRHESSSGSNRRRIEVEAGRDRMLASNSSSSKHNRSPKKSHDSGSPSLSKRIKTVSPGPVRRASPSRDHGKDRDQRRERGKNRDKAESKQRGRDERKDRRNNESDNKKALMMRIASRRAKTQEPLESSKKCPETRIQRTIENEVEEPKRPSVFMKSRLTSTIGAVVTNDANSSECEDDAEYDPSRPQLRSVATVAPRKRYFVDKDHLEKNKILAKALEDANRSTLSTAIRQPAVQPVPLVGRRSDDRSGLVKRSIQDRLGAYVTDAIVARVTEVKRRKEMPPSLGDEDDDDGENMVSNDMGIRRGGADEDAMNTSGNAGPRIIVTMKRIPRGIDTTALDADQEVEMEDLRLSLLRSSNAAELDTGVKEEASIGENLTKSPSEVSAQRSEKLGPTTLVKVESEHSLRKKMIVTNKNGVLVTPKGTEVMCLVEPNGIPIRNVTGGKPTAVAAPLRKIATEKKRKDIACDVDRDDKDVIMRNGMIVKPSPLLAACGVNVNTVLAIKRTAPANPVKPQVGSNSDNQVIRSAHQTTGTIITFTKTKSGIAEKIPLQSLDELAPKSALLTPSFNIGMPPMNLRVKQRCRFDPVCTNPVCRFVHPGQVCSSFPLCGLPAAMCTYRHPPCKFNHSCVNNACFYAHTEDG
ncbi:hypothetical protein BIW11_05772, partial [Tropilaelaps mercedesae]